MSKKTQTTIPDAWDDDWVESSNITTTKVPEVPTKLSKAERRAQHVEQQKQLWHTAENPGRNLWLESQGVIPLKQEPKQQVTLLSRKPPTIAKRDVTAGMSGLNIDDDDGDDSEEEARKKRESELEERQRRAKIEREEKQRKYAEARERIMGSSSVPSSSRDNSQARDSRKSRTKASGQRSRASPSDSPATQSPTRVSNSGSPQLFDPEDMGRRLPKRETSSNNQDDHPIRQPRGPESAGRGGFGFAGRGGSSKMIV